MYLSRDHMYSYGAPCLYHAQRLELPIVRGDRRESDTLRRCAELGIRDSTLKDSECDSVAEMYARASYLPTLIATPKKRQRVRTPSV